MTSPGGVGFRFLSCLTIGHGVGPLTLSTLLLGGETLQSGHGGGGGAHPQDIFYFFLNFEFFKMRKKVKFNLI
jgi:hypothetical protein